LREGERKERNNKFNIKLYVAKLKDTVYITRIYSMWNLLFMQDIMNAYLKRTVHIYQRPFHGKVAITIVRAPFPDFHFFSQDMQLYQRTIIVRYGHNVRNCPNRKQLWWETNNERARGRLPHRTKREIRWT